MISNKTIVGMMLASQGDDDLLDITITGLLKWCDWIVIVLDCESKEVFEKVNEYGKNNYGKIWIRRSSVPSEVFSKSGRKLTYHERWKGVKGLVRQNALSSLKDILLLNQKGFEKIDIVLWPDYDVIFTNYLLELLERFVNSDYKAISMKHVDAIGDLKTISQSEIGHHIHILKYSSDLAGLPRRFFALYHPLTERDLMKVNGYSVHLAYLTEKSREWRAKYWKTDKVMDRELIRLDKSVLEYNPEEIYENLSTKY